LPFSYVVPDVFFQAVFSVYRYLIVSRFSAHV